MKTFKEYLADHPNKHWRNSASKPWVNLVTAYLDFAEAERKLAQYCADDVRYFGARAFGSCPATLSPLTPTGEAALEEAHKKITRLREENKGLVERNLRLRDEVADKQTEIDHLRFGHTA
jgi:hypothetical protein